MAFTDIPLVKAALVAALAQRVASSDVIVRRGLPAELPSERRRIYVTRADAATRTPHDPARPLRSDRAEIIVVIEAHAADRDPAVAEGQVWALVEDLDATIVANPSLPGGWDAYLGRVDEEETGPVADGWIARCHARVVLDAVRV